MCGIAGIIQFDGTPADRNLVVGITNCMAHRGPDAESVYADQEMAFGHRRLSIIDLSDAAIQPFHDYSDRYIMVFNGEIYNYEEVKQQISGYPFSTSSDTEVLLAAYIQWGEGCLDYIRGMYAFVIWDRQTKTIFMARDRMGVKPLYYYLDANKLIFASEQRALLKAGLLPRTLDRTAIREYFSYQSIGFPHSAIQQILQLQAGTWMRIKEGRAEQKRYWNLCEPAGDFDYTNAAGVKAKIRSLLLQSVRRRLVSDVPVGAFLSGGIDSGVVVGMMAEASSARPNTFNIAFDEKEYDESGYAQMIADKFDTIHTRILLKPSVFLDELENALNAMDIPSGDGINTYVVSKAIRQHGMTVALSGVGGDELFAGYPLFDQYLQIKKQRWLWSLPVSLRQKLAASRATPANRSKMLQLAGAKNTNIESLYPVFRRIISPQLLAVLTNLPQEGPGILEAQLQQEASALSGMPLLSQVSIAEYLGYTQNTLLKDTDQMSMAVSLEVREPFFDQDLVSFVLSVPDSLKKPVYPKSLLVESVKPLLPDDIVFRKKQGFLFPWNVWLKQELRGFCSGLIEKAGGRDFIHAPALKDYWQRFLKGDPSTRWSDIWLFIVLEYWMEKNQIS